MKKLKLDELQRVSPEEFQYSEKLPLILVADNIRSALNVGSLFRTADAFALQEILLCGFTASPPHPDIRKTALGAEEVIPYLSFTDFEGAYAYLKEKGCKIFCLEQTDNTILLNDLQKGDLLRDDLHGDDLKAPVALVLGNEVGGVSEEWLKVCEAALEIPQFGTKHSLNVSVASGIAIWKIQELLRNSQK